MEPELVEGGLYKPGFDRLSLQFHSLTIARWSIYVNGKLFPISNSNDVFPFT